MKNLLGKLSIILPVIILIGVPFYAFLAVWGSTFLGHFTFLRLWPDILLAALALVALAVIARDKVARQSLFKNMLLQLIVLFAVLTLGLGLAGLANGTLTFKAFGYGVLTDLRFLVWFTCVWVVAVRYPWFQAHWRPIVLVPALIVSLFAILQFFALPANFLTHFGYDADKTYVPYITLNQNTTTIRPQSFTRGANPLGGYLATIVVIVTFIAMTHKKRSQYVGLAVVVALALFLSFSRSAWIGAILSLAILVFTWLKKYGQKALLAGAAALVVGVVAAAALTVTNASVQDAVLHVNDNSTAIETSNEGHASALKSSVQEMWHHPLGLGAGTAGPASWYNGTNNVKNSESFLLQIGEETGWAGLILFLAILYVIARIFWRARGEPLGIALFALVIGSLAINLLSYGWDDPTIAYVWWGIMALGMAVIGKEGELHETTS